VVEPDSKHGQLLATDQPHWDRRQFGDRCAGCHASGADSSQRTFATLSLDCFVCHGDVPDRHTTKPSLVHLSPQHKDPAAVVTSICAQCHLRTGSSRSSGLPYSNHFVAGDNLFRDFRVDLGNGAIGKLNPADRHVQENVRDVVVLGQEAVTCLSCHDVHAQSSQKHQLLADSQLCRNCHETGTNKLIRYTIHSHTCGY
jgi:predicted CXXCH cytochrome family protein